MTVEIKNGKLFQGGKEIKPEIGNPEHIRAIKLATEWEDMNPPVEEPKSDEEEVIVKVDTRAEEVVRYGVVRYVMGYGFKCICGKIIDEVCYWVEDYEREESALEEDISDERAVCRCGSIWKIREGNDGWEAVKR